MRYPPLVRGRLLRRYKRFLADVRLEDGRVVTAHTANTGAMTGCARAGSAVRLSRALNPQRKLPWTWELSRAGHWWVMINTLRANRLAEEAIAHGRIPELRGYGRLRREVAYGRSSRIDLLLEDGPRGSRALVEVKNVTLADGDRALFPDAVTERGRKQLRELLEVRDRKTRVVMLYCVSRGDCARFAPADAVDPLYGQALRRAARQGLEVLAWVSSVGPARASMDRPLPVEL